MDIQLERIEFIVTYQCNSNCRHCLIQPHLHNNETLDAEMARQMAEKLCKHFPLVSIMTFGGEPLLEHALETTLTIQRIAKQYNVPHRQILTNGIWKLAWGRLHPSAIPTASETEFIRQVALQIKLAGTTHVEISLDSFHQEHLPFQYAITAARVLIDVGVPYVLFSPRWINSPDFDCPENRTTQALLEEVHQVGFKSTKGEPIQPRGNAVDNFSHYFSPIILNGSETCSEQNTGCDLNNIRGVCISPLGDLIICKNLIIGRASSENIIEILENYSYRNFTDLKQLEIGGLQALACLTEENNSIFETPRFYSICDACFYLRKKAGLTKHCNA